MRSKEYISFERKPRLVPIILLARNTNETKTLTLHQFSCACKENIENDKSKLAFVLIAPDFQWPNTCQRIQYTHKHIHRTSISTNKIGLIFILELRENETKKKSSNPIYQKSNQENNPSIVSVYILYTKCIIEIMRITLLIMLLNNQNYICCECVLHIYHYL